MNPYPPSCGHARVGWITSLLLAVTLPRAHAYAFTHSPTGVIEPAPPTPTLEVELDPTIPDASDLSEWIHEESTKALAELPPSPTRRGTVRVSVSGTLYDYDVSIITIREDSTTETTTTWPCVKDRQIGSHSARLIGSGVWVGWSGLRDRAWGGSRKSTPQLASSDPR